MANKVDGKQKKKQPGATTPAVKQDNPSAARNASESEREETKRYQRWFPKGEGFSRSMTLAVTAATVINVIIVSFQWCAMRDELTETRKANKIASDTIAATQRAVVSVDEIRLSGPLVVGRNDIEIDVRNTGPTHAERVTMGGRAVLDLNDPGDIKLSRPFNPLPPESKDTFHLTIELSGGDPQREIDTGRTPLRFWISLQYGDQFRPWYPRERLCWQYHPGKGHFDLCSSTAGR